VAQAVRKLSVPARSSRYGRQGKKIALAALTERAAQRLSEMAGIEAKTIHCLLEFDPATRRFKRGVDDALPHDAIVVDEAS
jgi:exodeoxyribonuclease V alpha subunit